MRLRGLFLLVLLAFAPLVWAEQVSFKSRVVGNVVRFDYVWRDAAKQTRKLAFTLPVEDLQRGQQEFRPFDNAAMNEAGFKAVQDYATTHSVGRLKLKVSRTFNGFEVEAEGPQSAASQGVLKSHMEAMQKARLAGMDEYIRTAYYSRVSEGNVMPDHKRIVQRYGPALAPVQAAIKQATRGMPPREVVNFIMGFLQSIPYDLLNSRYTSNGAGFQTPYGLLTGNKGDCDTKAVALLALLRGIYPNIRLTMVYVPEHAFVGLALPRGPQDYALNLKGQAFVLADPTGPRELKLGEVDSSYLGDLEGGKYSYQEVLY